MGERFVVAGSYESAVDKVEVNRSQGDVHTHWIDAHRQLMSMGTGSGARIWRVIRDVKR